MLKQTDPLLSPDALYALCAMGHGEELAIRDAHYECEVTGKQTAYGKVMRMDGADTAQAIRPVLLVFGIDSFVVNIR